MSDLYEVDELYERSHRMDTVCSVLFWANCALSVLAFWPNTVQWVIICALMMTAIGHVVLGLVNDCALWFEAESANRKHLIEDAFGVDFTNRRSCGYYNNHFDKSAERFVTNAFESSFFTSSQNSSLPIIGDIISKRLDFFKRKRQNKTRPQHMGRGVGKVYKTNENNFAFSRKFPQLRFLRT